MKDGEREGESECLLTIGDILVGNGSDRLWMFFTYVLSLFSADEDLRLERDRCKKSKRLVLAHFLGTT